MRFNIIHLVVILVLFAIGVYAIPKFINDYLTVLVVSIFYNIALGLYMIFWVIKFGLSKEYSFKKMLKPPSDLNDYYLIFLIFFGSYIIAVLLSVGQKYHIFNFLNYNLKIFNIVPSFEIVKEWRILITFLVLLAGIVGVVSEELFIRAYLFEKQFLYAGSYTWVLNGFFWTTCHLFTKSNLLEFLPIALLYSFIYQKRRNIVITFIAHIMINLITIASYVFPLFNS